MPLREYQQTTADWLSAVIQEHGVALDTSDTGTGKTYTAIGVIETLQPSTTLVVCTKSLIPGWLSVSKDFQIALSAINYEKLRTGKTPWVKKIETGRVHRSRKKEYKFEWNLPEGALVIFDEAQKCSGLYSQNSKICALTKAYGINTLLLSATLADSPLKLRAVGYLTGLHDYRRFPSWIINIGGNLDYRGEPAIDSRIQPRVMVQVHHYLFPKYGARLKTKDIPGFPENQVSAQLCNLGDASKIDAAYEELAQADLEESPNPMVNLLRARQKVELVKMPGVVELAMDAIDTGMSVVVFVNFRDSLQLVHDALRGATVHGSQTVAQRAENIEQFQENRVKSIVVTTGAGGAGLSLHDLKGGHPRLSLVCPSYNAEELRQALGRIHREGSKSPAIQKILFAAGTVEEKIRSKVNAKLKCLDILNDGDLTI